MPRVCATWAPTSSWETPRRGEQMLGLPSEGRSSNDIACEASVQKPKASATTEASMLHATSHASVRRPVMPWPRWATPANPSGAWREAVSDDSVVLHYAYRWEQVQGAGLFCQVWMSLDGAGGQPSYSVDIQATVTAQLALALATPPSSYERDVAAKAHRSCPDTYLEAARRGDRSKVGVAHRVCRPARFWASMPEAALLRHFLMLFSCARFAPTSPAGQGVLCDRL